MNSINYITSTIHRRSSLDNLNNNININNIENDTENDNNTLNTGIDQKNNINTKPHNNSIIHGILLTIYNTIIFIPKLLIYYPIYYIIKILIYPFIKFHYLLLYIFYYFTYTPPSINDTFDDSISIPNSSPLILETPPSSSSFKSSISTILEESMEFNSKNESYNDDDFKSPLDIPNPIEDPKIEKPISKQKQIKKSSSSSSSSKKKKKFIFPKLLFNFNISNPPKNLTKKTLVLDLDETLIHSLSRYNSLTISKLKGKSIEVKVMGNLPTLYHIYKRPYVEEFLSIVYQWFDLICFTASIKEYADPVIDYLEEQVLMNDIMKKYIKNSKLNQPMKIFKKRYYRNSCIFMEGKGYVKDLSVLLDDNSTQNINTPTRSRTSSISSNISKSTLDYSKILIIDNSPISFVRHKDNGLMIEGWINDPDDNELINLLPLLNSLRFTSDVRCILSLKDGQRAFNY